MEKKEAIDLGLRDVKEEVIQKKSAGQGKEKTSKRKTFLTKTFNNAT